jgi:hypothetical protein
MGELAEGTGGTFFHNNNNLDAGLKPSRKHQKSSTCSSFLSMA